MNETNSLPETVQLRICAEVPRQGPQDWSWGWHNPVILDCAIPSKSQTTFPLPLYGGIGRYAETGAFWGGVWGFLFGCAFLDVSGNGSLFAAFGGAVLAGGLSAVAGVLYRFHIYQRCLLLCPKELGAGSFVPILEPRLQVI